MFFGMIARLTRAAVQHRFRGHEQLGGRESGPGTGVNGTGTIFARWCSDRSGCKTASPAVSNLISPSPRQVAAARVWRQPGRRCCQAADDVDLQLVGCGCAILWFGPDAHAVEEVSGRAYGPLSRRCVDDRLQLTDSVLAAMIQLVPEIPLQRFDIDVQEARDGCLRHHQAGQSFDLLAMLRSGFER
jgi:hypothetical protein